MDYVLRETGNTYIAAVTSHTTYWSNIDVANFMLSKLHPELEQYARQNANQPTQQQQPQSTPVTTVALGQPLQQQPVQGGEVLAIEIDTACTDSLESPESESLV